MPHKRTNVTILAVAAICFSWGCGGGSPPPVSSSSQETKVQGTVTINGKPATGGEITFDPANINRPDAVPQTFPIGEDGSYSGSSLVGENAVSVKGPSIDLELSMNRKQVELTAGENTVPITLP